MGVQARHDVRRRDTDDPSGSPVLYVVRGRQSASARDEEEEEKQRLRGTCA